MYKGFNGKVRGHLLQLSGPSMWPQYFGPGLLWLDTLFEEKGPGTSEIAAMIVKDLEPFQTKLTDQKSWIALRTGSADILKHLGFEAALHDVDLMEKDFESLMARVVDLHSIARMIENPPVNKKHFNKLVTQGLRTLEVSNYDPRNLTDPLTAAKVSINFMKDKDFRGTLKEIGQSMNFGETSELCKRAGMSADTMANMFTTTVRKMSQSTSPEETKYVEDTIKSMVNPTEENRNKKITDLFSSDDEMNKMFSETFDILGKDLQPAMLQTAYAAMRRSK